MGFYNIILLLTMKHHLCLKLIRRKYLLIILNFLILYPCLTSWYSKQEFLKKMLNKVFSLDMFPIPMSYFPDMTKDLKGWWLLAMQRLMTLKGLMISLLTIFLLTISISFSLMVNEFLLTMNNSLYLNLNFVYHFVLHIKK